MDLGFRVKERKDFISEYPAMNNSSAANISTEISSSVSEVAARTADRVASLHHLNMEVLNIFLLKYCIVQPAELC